MSFHISFVTRLAKRFVTSSPPAKIRLAYSRRASRLETERAGDCVRFSPTRIPLPCPRSRLVGLARRLETCQHVTNPSPDRAAARLRRTGATQTDITKGENDDR